MGNVGESREKLFSPLDVSCHIALDGGKLLSSGTPSHKALAKGKQKNSLGFAPRGRLSNI